MRVSSPARGTLNLFLPLYLPSFLFALSNGLLIPVLPLFAQGFRVSYGLVGVVLAGDSIGMLIGDLPSGMLMRRLGQKSSMIVGLSLSGLSTAALFLAPNILTVVLLRMVAGLGISLFNVSRHYFLAVMTPAASRGRIISIWGGVYRLGRLLGPIGGGLIGAAFGLRASFLAFGAACALALLVVIYFLPHVEVTRQDRPGSGQSALDQFAAMLKCKWRDLSTAGLGCLFMQAVRAGPPVLIPLYAANYLNMSVETIGVVLSLSSILDVVMFYPAGLIMDRYGRKVAILSSNLILALGMALVPLAHGFASLLAAGMVAGLGSGLGAGSMLTLGSDLSPAEGRSEFLGAWTLIGDLGSTSGPLLTGNLADVMPLPATGWVIACGGLVALLIFGLMVPETLKKAGAPAASGEISGD